MEIIEIKNIGINEIWLHIKKDNVEYSGCLTEIQK